MLLLGFSKVSELGVELLDGASLLADAFVDVCQFFLSLIPARSNEACPLVRGNLLPGILVQGNRSEPLLY